VPGREPQGGVAGGIILVIIAVTMVLGSGDSQQFAASEGRDPMRIALFPLAIPYLLNPAGIVTLVTLSAEADSVAVFAMVLGLMALRSEAVMPDNTGFRRDSAIVFRSLSLGSAPIPAR
jgi:small neutral amino acid transporter SnatA (MarC family)